MPLLLGFFFGAISSTSASVPGYLPSELASSSSEVAFGGETTTSFFFRLADFLPAFDLVLGPTSLVPSATAATSFLALASFHFFGRPARAATNSLKSSTVLIEDG